MDFPDFYIKNRLKSTFVYKNWFFPVDFPGLPQLINTLQFGHRNYI